MRTALCLSGNMRTYAHTYNNLKLNFIDPNACDIFISTWDVLGNGKHSHCKTKAFLEPLNEAHVRDTYGANLKKLRVFNFAEGQAALPKVFYPGMVSMYWQVLQADLLRQEYEKENNIQYDCIIRARPDHLFHTGVAMSDPSPIMHNILVRDFRENMMDDTLAIGNREMMTYYSTVFNQLENYYKFKEFFRVDPLTNAVGWPEQILWLHLQRGKIPLKTFPITYEIYRGDYPVEEIA